MEEWLHQVSKGGAEEDGSVAAQLTPPFAFASLAPRRREIRKGRPAVGGFRKSFWGQHYANVQQYKWRTYDSCRFGYCYQNKGESELPFGVQSG